MKQKNKKGQVAGPSSPKARYKLSKIHFFLLPFEIFSLFGCRVVSILCCHFLLVVGLRGCHCLLVVVGIRVLLYLLAFVVHTMQWLTFFKKHV